MKQEPLAAHLYFIPRALRRPQAAIVEWLRAYFEQAPGWVLLTTRGRKTGLPREVLLPCGRSADSIVVISTYGWRSHWIRNLREDPDVQVTCAGWPLRATAEIIEDLEAKQSTLAAIPFFPPAPFVWVHAVLCTILRPVLIFLLRRWVIPRPIVVIRRCTSSS
jgi:deazaflavin-dependent oxidoreductase (nitroreductase family)